MQMFACAATCGTSDANGEAGENGLAFGDEDSGEVAVADAEVTVAERDEVAGTGVVACLFYCAAEYGIDDGGMAARSTPLCTPYSYYLPRLRRCPLFRIMAADWAMQRRHQRSSSSSLSLPQPVPGLPPPPTDSA